MALATDPSSATPSSPTVLFTTGSGSGATATLHDPSSKVDNATRNQQTRLDAHEMSSCDPNLNGEKNEFTRPHHPRTILHDPKFHSSATTSLDLIVCFNFPISTKLNQTNYLTWRSQILPLIEGYNLSKFLYSSPQTTDGTDWRRQDQLLLGWMRASISESVLDQVVLCATTAELWSTLLQTFISSSQERRTDLRRQLQNITKGSLSCSEYLQKIRKIADELAFVASPVTEEDLVGAAREGLIRSDYNAFSASRDPMTFSELHDLLLKHEVKKSQTSAAMARPKRIDPILLRAIVNGDLILFKKEIEKTPTNGGNETNVESNQAPTDQNVDGGISLVACLKKLKILFRPNQRPKNLDVESTGLADGGIENRAESNQAPTDHNEDPHREAHGGNSGIGVTYGGDNCLHVVAGATMKFRPVLSCPVVVRTNEFIADVREELAQIWPSPENIRFLQPVILVLKKFAYLNFLILLINYFIIRFLISRALPFLWQFLKNLCWRWRISCTKGKDQSEKIIYKILKRTPRDNLIMGLLNLEKRIMHMKIAQIIYSKDPNSLIDLNDAMKETPLHSAAKAGKFEMVVLLIEFARKKGEGKLTEVLCAQNKVGETALHEAARSGYYHIVKKLLHACPNLVNSLDRNGISPLFLAVVSGSFDVVRVLLGSEQLQSKEEREQLRSQEESEQLQSIGESEQLQSKEESEQLRPYAGPNGQTALHAAVMSQKGDYFVRKIVREILEKNPKLANTPDNTRNTPLHYAALIGNSCAARQLLQLEDKATVYQPNSSGSFPVHLAAEAGHITVIEELLRSCPDVGELLDTEQRNFLHVAVENKRQEVIRLACKNGINPNVINAKDKDGNTPLHLAIINSNSEIFYILLQNKRLNPNIRNTAGLTPLDISTSLQDHQFTYTLNPQSIIRAALLRRGAFQNPCQPDISKIVDNFVKRGNGERAGFSNERKGKETINAVVDEEKESTKLENMSKSLIMAAVLIASATFLAMFNVSKIYLDNSHTLLWRDYVFWAFVIADVLAFILAIVSTNWLLYSALTNFHLKYRKFYFKWSTPLLYYAINLFILAFGLGSCVAIMPISQWVGLFLVAISGLAISWNYIWYPKFVPLILLKCNV